MSERSPYDGDAIVVLPRQLAELVASHFDAMLGDEATWNRRRELRDQLMAILLEDTPKAQRLQADEDAVTSDATPYTHTD